MVAPSRTRPALLTLVIAAAVLEASAGHSRLRSFARRSLLVVALSARLDEGGRGCRRRAGPQGARSGIAIALLLAGRSPRRHVRALAGEAALRAAGVIALECVGAIAAADCCRRPARWRDACRREPGRCERGRGGFAQVASSAAVDGCRGSAGGARARHLWSEGVRGWFAPLRHGPRANLEHRSCWPLQSVHEAPVRSPSRSLRVQAAEQSLNLKVEAGTARATSTRRIGGAEGQGCDPRLLDLEAKTLTWYSTTPSANRAAIQKRSPRGVRQPPLITRAPGRPADDDRRRESRKSP